METAKRPSKFLLDSGTATHSHLLAHSARSPLPEPQSASSSAASVRRAASITRTTVHTLTYVTRSASVPRGTATLVEIADTEAARVENTPPQRSTAEPEPLSVEPTPTSDAEAATSSLASPCVDGATSPSRRTAENVRTIVTSDVLRELVEPDDGDEELDLADTVRIYSADEQPPLDVTASASSPTPTAAQLDRDRLHEALEFHVNVKPADESDRPQKPVFLQLPSSQVSERCLNSIFSVNNNAHFCCLQLIQLEVGEPLRAEVTLLANPPATVRWYGANSELQPTADATITIDDRSPNYSALTCRQPPIGIVRVVAMNAFGLAA